MMKPNVPLIWSNMAWICGMLRWCTLRPTITLESLRGDESRLMDIALVEIMGVVLALVYVERGETIRVISLRRASKAERKLYENTKQN